MSAANFDPRGKLLIGVENQAFTGRISNIVHSPV
jgi:hypothetical protein